MLESWNRPTCGHFHTFYSTEQSWPRSSRIFGRSFAAVQHRRPCNVSSQAYRDARLIVRTSRFQEPEIYVRVHVRTCVCGAVYTIFRDFLSAHGRTRPSDFERISYKCSSPCINDLEAARAHWAWGRDRLRVKLRVSVS